MTGECRIVEESLETDVTCEWFLFFVPRMNDQMFSQSITTAEIFVTVRTPERLALIRIDRFAASLAPLIGMLSKEWIVLFSFREISRNDSTSCYYLIQGIGIRCAKCSNV